MEVGFSDEWLAESWVFEGQSPNASDVWARSAKTAHAAIPSQLGY